MVIEFMFPRSSGSSFHSIGSATEKALIPYVFRLYFATTKSPLLIERNRLAGVYGVEMLKGTMGP